VRAKPVMLFRVMDCCLASLGGLFATAL
jgi:hypothetical protein